MKLEEPKPERGPHPLDDDRYKGYNTRIILWEKSFGENSMSQQTTYKSKQVCYTDQISLFIVIVLKDVEGKL